MLEKTRLIDHNIWWQKKLTYFRRQNIYCRGWSLFRRHWSKKKYSYRKNCQETSNFGLQRINEFWNGMNGMTWKSKLSIMYRIHTSPVPVTLLTSLWKISLTTVFVLNTIIHFYIVCYYKKLLQNYTEYIITW